MTQAAQGLDPGAPAPDFSTRNQYGQTVSLGDLRGAPSVLIFYPWAFSSICTGELRSLRDRWQRFDELGARVVAVSCDAMFALRAYADARADAAPAVDVNVLHAKIGELTLANDFLAGALGKAGLLASARR